MVKRMKVALLSHRGGNIGHDFMAAGMEVVAREAFGADVEIAHYEQHRPFEVYSKGHPLRLVDRIPYGKLDSIKRMLNRPPISRALWLSLGRLDARLAIACGGPNIVDNAWKSVEMGSMFHHLPGAFHSQGVPVIDAAVGACYPLERVPSSIDHPKNAAFYRRLFSYCAASTVRDDVARRLWSGLGREVQLIPCAAIASGRTLEMVGSSPSKSARVVLINFQERGANEDWGQKVDVALWTNIIRELVQRMSRRHELAFICHNDKEASLSKAVAPSVPVYQPRDIAEYGRVISNAKAALVSRVHAAIPLAGIGVPSITVGTDTRLGTVKLMGLEGIFVKEASVEYLEDRLEHLMAIGSAEAERLRDVREKTIFAYRDLILKISGG